MRQNYFSHHRARRMIKRRAFTLIEILIVVAIIALLAAILFPVFSRARENARRSSCTSNLKQLALGMLQYAQDYDERYFCSQLYPPIVVGGVTIQAASSGYWFNLLAPYTKNTQLFHCPDVSNTPYIAALWSNYNWNITGTYNNGNPATKGNGFGFTYWDPTTPTGTITVALSEVSEPSNTILISEIPSDGNSYTNQYTIPWARSQVPVLHGGFWAC